MKRLDQLKKSKFSKLRVLIILCLGVLFWFGANVFGQVTFEQEVKITDSVLFFDGTKVADLDYLPVNPDSLPANSAAGYDYAYGNALTPLGDCVKAFKHFVFLTWYRGGKDDRHVMLTRYNTLTKTKATIEFPHQHTGFDGNWWIGETHNTIAVGICPKDSSVHLLYDMHRNGNVAAFASDYLRYSYSFDGAATVADEDFTLDRFVNSPAGNYKHLAFDGIDDVNTTKLLTYPAFFTNDEGDLFMKMRFGYDRNGKFLFARFDGDKWNGYTEFNRMLASKDSEVAFNWGLYGDFKYLNGKLRIGFQRRYDDENDKFLYQNGIYYAYSDDPEGVTQWKDYKGLGFTRPLANADKILVAEPGDWVTTTQKDMVYIVSGFDFTVTDRGDEHFVSIVKDNENNVTKKLHTYRKAGDADFTTVEYSAGSALYAAGNDVYVIGLTGGRVNIVKTAGGTNDFKQVYQNTTGPTFDKGVVNVYDGKAYYYLKQSGGSGDRRTTYLQVFDLDIDTTPRDTSRYLSFENIVNEQEIELGTNLTIHANVGSAFKEVSLWSGDTNLGTLMSAPYQWSSHAILTDMTDPSYTFKLLAKDSAGVAMETSVTITTPEVFKLSELTSLHISFEDEAIANWETDGADYGVTPAIVEGINVRTGSRVLALDYTAKTSGHHVQNMVDKIAVPDQHYLHLIAYTATSDIANGVSMPTVQLGDWKPTPTFTTHSAVNTFQRKVTSRQNTKGESLNCAPRLRTKANGPCVVYYDDIVLYTDENETADLTAPSMAEDMVVKAPATDGVEISWTEGLDETTGVNATLVLRTSNSAAEVPVMQAQAAYNPANDNSRASVVGDWTVIALLPNGTTTYIDKAISSEVSYKYAVVHKDMAYNYSSPLVSGDGVNAIFESEGQVFKCVGIKGAIELSELQQGEILRIYNVSGVKVLEKDMTFTHFFVSIQQGVYLVEFSGEVKKIIVK